jgi:hypothetical protein
MFTTQRALSTLALALTLSSGIAAAHAASSDYGMNAAAASPARQITLQANSRYVNVADGETVRFVMGEQSFVWHFSTLRGETSFDLAEIAPQGWQLPAVRVYVATNPLYRG